MGNRDWNPKYKLSYLPLSLRNIFLKEAETLYQELTNNRLKVVLVPAPNPTHYNHKIRVVENSNPEWYSSLYFETNRGKRRLFEKSISRLVKGEDQDFNEKNEKYSYDQLFRELIYSRLLVGYIERGEYFTEPNNKIRKYFNLESINLNKKEKE